MKENLHNLSLVLLLLVNPVIPPYGNRRNPQRHHGDSRDAAVLHVFAPGVVNGSPLQRSDVVLHLLDVASVVNRLELRLGVGRERLVQRLREDVRVD